MKGNLGLPHKCGWKNDPTVMTPAGSASIKSRNLFMLSITFLSDETLMSGGNSVKQNINT